MFKIARATQEDFDWKSVCGILCQFGPKEIEVCLSQMQLPASSSYHELVEDYWYWFSGFAKSTQPGRGIGPDDRLERLLTGGLKVLAKDPPGHYIVWLKSASVRRSRLPKRSS